MKSGELFDAQSRVELDEGVVLLRARALAEAPALLAALAPIFAAAPLRHMVTPGGLTMSVAMTNCGECGWVSDRKGYRYASVDPDSGRPWPALPALLAALASAAAAEAGFPDFAADVCLVNEYVPGTKLTLHQDRDEASFAWPIVSVSLGATATFLLGGLRRRDRAQRLPLQHGDVLVWGGPARLRYHGILPLKAESHPLLGERRLNLTLRRAL
ncbi:MAG TPA: DNA oxidative demethylase AlkB [Gammaproteobacteria bacterium]|nr:DNA oxidative demethylase AlkB [Gammaproteobacteria bacterium]